ncbi:MAG: APC family permease [Eubacteriaceae bacterium]|nr:APC family permease [Eubacteriaceae bacterium]
MTKKKAKISLLGLVVMIIVPVAGGGYGIEDLVSTAGPGITMLIFICIPFIWSLPFGLVAAEMSGRYPENGGMYTWAKNSLGEKAGFAAGWAYSIAGFIEPATFATLSANYIKSMFPFEISHLAYWGICAGLILLFTVINFYGVKVLSNIATVVTIVCVIPFVFLIVLSFMNIEFSPINPLKPENMSFMQAAGQGLLIGIWFNTGYETIATMAGEIKDGAKMVPKAIVIAVPIVSIMYALFVIPALGAVGHWESWSSEGPLSFVTIGKILGGPALQWAFTLSGTLSSVLILSEYIAANSRVMATMSKKGEFFKFMGIEHKKYETPYVALIIIAVVNIIMCSSSSFVELVGLSATLYAVPIILMFIGAIKVRFKNPDEQVGYRVPVNNKVFTAYVAVPIVLYIFSVFCDEWLVGVCMALTCIPAYFFFKHLYKGGSYWKETHCAAVIGNDDADWGIETAEDYEEEKDA